MKYLADIVSLFRILSVLPVVYFSYGSKWELALTFLVLGWGSDLLDGWLARRFGSLRDSKPDFDADGIADSALAFGSSAVPVIYVTSQYGWTWGSPLIGLWLLTVVSGIAMVMIMGKPLTTQRRWLVAGNMLIMHGLVQIVGTLCWFAYMTYGIIGIDVMIILMIPVILKQQPKMWLWLDGRLE